MDALCSEIDLHQMRDRVLKRERRRSMKGKAVIFFAVACFFLALSNFSFSAEFWASTKGEYYHNPSCAWARKIRTEDLVKYTSPEEAKKAGYKPCKFCKPPEASDVSQGGSILPESIKK
jgi:hypothetical protein